MQLSQFNSMIQFYVSAHSDNAELTVFENNGRVITSVKHSDWLFICKVNQEEPTAELVFTHEASDITFKRKCGAQTYGDLLGSILVFHHYCMSKIQ